MKLRHKHTPPPFLLRDVTLRDGLQSIPEILTTDEKMSVFESLVDAGVQDFQLTSFVNPARIPQLADAEEFYARAKGRGVHLAALVANLKGFERAKDTSVPVIDAVLSASEAYNKKNSSRSIEESAAEIEIMLSRAAHSGATVDVSIANCFHCFTEGVIDPAKVLALTKRFHDAGARTIWLADTTGHAESEAVADLVTEASQIGVGLGMHLHDTLGRAGDNALAAYNSGARRFDVVLGGMGGSPFTPGVGGNLSLETAFAVFTEAGIETGVDGVKLDAARNCFSNALSAARARIDQ
jgi:hydroxymethylglutaryl-CoA lyase